MRQIVCLRNRFSWLMLLLLLYACKPEPPKVVLFESLQADKTGLNFVNKLTPTPAFNPFHYMYFYNGGGIGAGDFNNDGLIDLFFSGNQVPNRLYLNGGSLHFTDVSSQALPPPDSAWSTGVSVVDINGDGLLDIYVCRVGNYETLKSRNQLLVCQGINKAGIPVYKDLAAGYGLDFSGFSTQASFLDYDADGDLDCFLLNHSVHQNGSFSERKNFLGTYSELSGDRLYRNDGDKFTDVTRQTGINSSSISYGLGIAASDINLDGYPDLYIGNDFHENDYLYINQHNGTFKDEVTEKTMHTSQFSMGVDIGDINNDAAPEIISMDMLPADPYILKRSLGENEYDIFNLKISFGYNYQYTRNNLQWNRGNGLFSEVGLYAGVYATDWSWAPLWMDFDNDGWKDLFISNGIPKRLNDMDYVNYISNEEIQEKLRTNSLEDKDMTLIDKFPQIKLPNRFFKNGGKLDFQDINSEVEGDLPTYSNGAVYADFDNDGDLDIVVNNVDDPVLLYKNRSNDKGDKPFLELKLKGPALNTHAVGAKVIVFAGNSIRTYEKFATRGFQSSMEIPVHIGLAHTKADSIIVVWPDNTFQRVVWNGKGAQLALSYQPGLPRFDYASITARSVDSIRPVADITQQTGLNYLHQENPFNEFDREPLIPHMVSREGPALAVGDINGDGLEDVFIGASKTYKSAVFLQTKGGNFAKTAQPALDADSMFEAVDACWADVNGDGHPDLLTAPGGNEYYGQEEQRTPHVYLNDGQAHFTKWQQAFTGLYLTASCIAPCDIDGDGDMDLFVGGRAVPWEYGQTPVSYLLQNDGAGHFKDITAMASRELQQAGLVTNARWCDIDRDGDSDLVVTAEWGGIDAYINNKGTFSRMPLTTKKGWWNFVLPCDVNGDGAIDFIAGNLGLNSRLKASEAEPVRLYYNDFDDNGKKDEVLTYYLDGRELPFANKDELQRQMPFLKKKFLYAEDFAKASLPDIFGSEKLDAAQVLRADYFSNALLLNDGHGHFTTQALPWQAQLSPYNTAAVVDANGDPLPDILLGGNFYENNIQMGRYDADFGTLLINRGRGQFSCANLNGLAIKGQVRKIRKMTIGGKEAFILARNNDSTLVIQFGSKRF
ncbi:MAG: VCBS repeat-containing protein [Williamsia sp.]|nr:VCBS repeat-containing protein [Williamsia sp.]